MADVTYVSRVRVEPVEGRVRRAYIPGRESRSSSAYTARSPSTTESRPTWKSLIPPLSTSSWLLRAADCSEPSGARW